MENGLIRVKKNVISIKNRDKAAVTKNKLIVHDLPKTEASNRTVPLTKRSLQILKEMYDSRTSEIVFPSEKNTYVSLRNYQRTFYKILEKAGMDKCSNATTRKSLVQTHESSFFVFPWTLSKLITYISDKV